MFKRADPYTFTKYYPLLNGSTQIGNLYLEYQVTSYEDVQLANASAATKAQNRKFLVHCTQKINIWNPNGVSIGPIPLPSPPPIAYENFPVLISTSIQINNAADVRLLHYSPQTINTKVESSHSDTDAKGNTNGNSRSSTVGSSTSQTNSYGASVSAGLTDFSASSHYDHSSTDTQEQSSTTGTESGQSQSHDASASASMSIKDWGAYAMVEPGSQKPIWSFGQEYPWDVFQCRFSVQQPPLNGQVALIIPDEMASRLVSSNTDRNIPFLYPPSQLSMFGFSFLTKALWLITIDDAIGPANIELDHLINYFSASQSQAVSSGIPQPSVYVFMDPTPAMLATDPTPPQPKTPTASTTINLPLMALNPLALSGKPSIIGFIPSKFVVLPAAAQGTTAPVPFTIVSTTNDLLILDTSDYSKAPTRGDAGVGFTASQTALAARFSTNYPALQMTLYFKVVDSVSDYMLFMKQWKTVETNIALKFVINGDTNNSITKYVDALEAEGGEKNLLSFSLRNQDYASVEYHDYLQLGLNSIQITITPMGTNLSGSGYQIRAISIERF